jgi:uncharacterized protein (DUF2267 family)
MQYDVFLKQVVTRCGLESRADGEKIIQATFETMAERMAFGEPYNLAAQLPEPIKGYLNQPGADESHKYTVDEFIQRVAERAGIETASAESHIRVVLAVLAEAVSPGEMHDTRVQFPPEYSRLFEDGQQRAASA